MSKTVQIINASTVLSGSVNIFLIDASAGDLVLTLPYISQDGQYYELKRTDNTQNSVTIQGYTAQQNINGNAFIKFLAGSYNSVVSLNSVWYLL
jgi:hypothetical protein